MCILELMFYWAIAWRFDSSSFMVEHSDRIQHLPASEDNYTLLKKNSIKLEKSICDSLQALEKKGEINVTLRKKIAPQHSYPPQLFRLSKIHKPDICLHPIISSFGLATYYLTKELARILGPLKGQLESYIKNSAHLVGSKLCGLTGNSGQLC